MPVASKADDIRREAAKAVADWKASRPVPALASAQSAAPAASAQAESIQLDALFDGSFPSSREVLSRAGSLGLSDSAVALALSESKSPSDAAARLSALGVLGSKESALAASNEAEFRFLLTRLWRKTAASVPAAFPVDRSFGVPALKVERGGVAYFVHGVAHGQYGAPRRSAVLSLVRRVAAAGRSLYSEQNLPAYYGYKKGLETLDHSASAMPEVVPAAPGFTRSTLFVKRAIDWAVAPGSALAALTWVIAVPASPFAWLLLPLAAALSWLILSGGLPLMAWKRRRLSVGARGEGLEDIAEQYADEAKHFFVAKPDLEILRGLELPQPLGASTDVLSARSRAIADAVAADAAASGASAVHLVVGHLHAHEVASRLAEGNGQAAPAGPGGELSGWKHLSRQALSVLRLLKGGGVANGRSLMKAAGLNEAELAQALSQLQSYPFMSLVGIAGDASAQGAASAVASVVPSALGTIDFLLNKTLENISADALTVLRQLRRQGMLTGGRLMRLTGLDKERLMKALDELQSLDPRLIGVAGGTTELFVEDSVSSIQPSAQNLATVLLKHRL